MPKITIQEIDISTPGDAEITSNAVYIPGLLGRFKGSGEEGGHDKPTSIDITKPYKYETVDAFKAAVGDYPYRFVVNTEQQDNGEIVKYGGGVKYNEFLTLSDLDSIKKIYTTKVKDEKGDLVDQIGYQYYEVLEYLGINADGTIVKDGAPLESPNFIDENSVDKSYIMAIELLSQGIPVYYQIIADPEDIIPTTSAEIVDKVDNQIRKLLIISGTKESDITDEMIGNYPGGKKLLEQALEEHFIITNIVNKVNEQIKELLINSGIPEGSITDEMIDNYPGGEKLLEQALEESPLTDNKSKSLAILNTIYSKLFNYFTYSNDNPLSDMGRYVFKFLTTGGYPVFDKDNLAKLMCEFAMKRYDLTALIDYFDFYEHIKGGLDTLHKVVSEWNDVSSVSGSESDKYTYGAMFAPYALYQPTALNLTKDIDPQKEQDQASNTLEMAASFGYLMAFATSVRSYPSYYATAGVARGSIPDYFAPLTEVSTFQADALQPRDGKTSINPIVNVEPYGTKIWGNRTLKNNTGNTDLVATSFLNIRILANEVKRYLFAAARRYTFEQNSDVLWINFKSMIIPKLEAMIQSNGITGYRFVRLRTTQKATLKARLIIECVEAVEDFELQLYLTDAVLSVEEANSNIREEV